MAGAISVPRRWRNPIDCMDMGGHRDRQIEAVSIKCRPSQCQSHPGATEHCEHCRSFMERRSARANAASTRMAPSKNRPRIESWIQRESRPQFRDGSPVFRRFTAKIEVPPTGPTGSPPKNRGRRQTMDNRGPAAQSTCAEIEVDQWILEARDHGVILVRIPSRPGPDRLPDAVFTFRPGDPQYGRWERRLTQGLVARS